MRKIFLTILLAFLMVINVCPTVAFASESNDGNILEELESVDLEPYKTANKTTLITLSENGFGTNDYELFIYVYYAEKRVISKSEISNVINIAVKFDDNHNAVEYANVKLKQIAKTEDNSIYKFKIIDDGNVLKQSTAQQFGLFGERKYDVAGVQLLMAGERTARDYYVGISYVYSGLESSKTHKLDTLETIELEVKPAWYRTDTSDKGKYYQNQLNSVYFAVPEKYFQDGYTLTAVKAEWYEYSTMPIVVLNNNEVYNGLQSYIGKNIGKSNKDVPYNLHAGKWTLSQTNSDSGFTTTTHSYDWCYNVPEEDWFGSLFTTHVCSYYSSRLTYLFDTKGQDASTYILPSEELTDYIYNYKSSADKGFLDIKNGQISADLFKDGVDEGRTRGYNCLEISVDDTFDLLSYKDTHTWWDTVADYGLFNTLFGKVPQGEESKRDVTPIYEVKPEDLTGDVKENILISNELVEDFKNYYNAQDGKRTFMFRFGNTDYKSIPLSSHNGYVAEETVFLDFDIIHLKFSNGNNTIVYPVVSNPIDIVPSITPPVSENLQWVVYAIVGVALSVVGIIVYNLFKGEKA